MKKMYYFDNAATTFPKPECVYQAVDKGNRELAFNAGRGTYEEANTAAGIITSCRTKLISLFESDGVVFEPSATMALNAIIMGLDIDSTKNVYVSPYEHNAVIRPLHMKSPGSDVRIMPVDSQGKIDLDRLRICFTSAKPDYVFVTHISNVTGYILPVSAISRLAHEYGATVIVDCSQSAGLLDTRIKMLDADYAVFAGHKTLYATLGVAGFAYGKAIRTLKSVFAGGTGSDSLNIHMSDKVPEKFEAGSYNIPAIYGLSEALDWKSNNEENKLQNGELELTKHIIYGLLDNSRIKVYWTADINSHMSVISMNHKDYMADELAGILDQDYQISVRSGYHCAPYVHDVIGSKPKRGTVRISIGRFTTKDDADYLLKVLKEL